MKRYGARQSACLSVSVPAWTHKSKPAVAGLLLWTQQAGDSNRLLLVVARSFFGGVAMRYVLPVLWMTSCLYIMPQRKGHALKVTPQVAAPWRGLQSTAPLLVLYF